ncbi:S-layer homology domain-containing protein [Sporosarcina sp. Sa2YVA2]|uniref:S-layer homology domain-containing protein n=1 Tax=Sporosarcina quadrami TaxID=2762234 RepID=A0ABR8UD73_9BACL|nr:S-layer homology domain-containing protein [Sporosarcina quadrami]MBD7985983.1 S-layer homology domain-containing protein [Sporosarcina quadrami]
MDNQQKKYRNFMIGAASAALVASAVAPTSASAADFSDVKGNTHEAAINALVDAGVIKGYPDGTFKPNKSLNRSDVVKMLGKWLESMDYKVPADYKTNPRFTDHTSKTNDELLKYAALVKDYKVFGGYEDGSLGAAKPITRENMAVVLVRAYDAVYKTDLVTMVKGMEFDKDVTDRTKAKAEARPYIDVLDYFDITNPAAPQFNPKGTTTRGQFASLLYKTSLVDMKEEVDTEAPKLVYTGEKTIEVAYGANFSAPVVTATDNVDEKVEVTSVITNEAGERLTAVDTKVYGTYKITYSAVDAAGNNAEDVVVTVKVAEPNSLEVASVEGLSATQVQVHFNLPVDKTTVFNTDGTLKTGVVTMTSLDGVAPGNLTGTLSADGKTLTITTQNAVSKRYDVVVDNVKSYNGKNIVKYTGMVTLSEDKTAPTVVKTDRLSASKFKVTFSEPIKELGTVTYKLANGTVVSGTGNGVTNDFTVGATAVTFTIGSDVTANQDVMASLVGTRDMANNLISPNPTNITFQKGDKDGVKPAVSTITQTGAKSFAIKFSEELQVAPTVTVAGMTGITVAKDANDPTVYNVTTTEVLDDAKTVTITNFTDLSGEMGDSTTKVVTFVQDINAPKVQSSKVVSDETNMKQYLEITFDKNVDLGTNPTVDATGSFVKDYVTTTINDNALSAAPVTYKNAGNKKVVRVELDTFLGTTFDVEGAAYTLDLTFANVASEFGVAAPKASVSFVRGTDGTPANTAKVGVESIIQDTNDNNKVNVTFDKKVDGATASNVANYSISGAIVESVTLMPFANDKQVAVLNLKPGSNTFTGVRNISVQNVKAAGSTVAMDVYTTNTVSLKENVAPTVTAAKLVGTNQVELTFSEAVTTTAGTQDFELLIGGSTVATKSVVTSPASAGQTKVTFNLENNVSSADIINGLTLKPLNTHTVVDGAGNKVTASSPITIVQ